MLRGIPASALRSALGAQCHPHTLPLSVRIAQKPSIVGSLGPTALKYESSEGKGTSSMGLPPGGTLCSQGLVHVCQTYRQYNMMGFTHGLQSSSFLGSTF